MAEPLRLPAPAKLNLMLNIVGRRDDGYHLLQTVFQFIDLCDLLEFRLDPQGRIGRAAGNSPVTPQDDILIAAARRLQQHCDISMGVEIGIDKRIPIGGGLGGGSSDAATCLLALNRLWDLGLSLDQLAAIGLEIGADVPVFVHGRSAWASGIGEVIEPIDPPPSVYLVIDPKTPVSTAEIFNAPELTRNNDPLTIRAFLRGSGNNVCEPVVRQRYPEVGAALDWLQNHATARMSGTGACVFAAFDSVAQAEVVKSRVPESWDAYVARAMNRNPVHQQLQTLG